MSSGESAPMTPDVPFYPGDTTMNPIARAKEHASNPNQAKFTPSSDQLKQLADVLSFSMSPDASGFSQDQKDLLRRASMLQNPQDLTDASSLVTSYRQKLKDQQDQYTQYLDKEGNSPGRMSTIIGGVQGADTGGSGGNQVIGRPSGGTLRIIGR